MRHIFLLCLVFLFALQAVEAQQPTERPKGVRPRLVLLESQVDELSQTLQAIVGSEEPQHLRRQSTQLLTRVDALTADLEKLRQETYARNQAMQEHDDRLDAIGEEIEGLWAEVNELKRLMKERMLKPNAGYDNGFFIASADRKFEIKLSGFVKPFYLVGFQEPPPDHESDTHDTEIDESGFQLSSARLSIETKVFEVIHGLLEIDFGTLSGTKIVPTERRISHEGVIKLESYGVRMMSVYGEYAPLSQLKVRAGQFKVPFDREMLFRENELTFGHRSLITRRYPLYPDGRRYWQAPSGFDANPSFSPDEFELQRAASFGWDRGIQLHGAIGEGVFNYALGAFNGAGINVNNNNRDLLLIARVWSDLLGPVTSGMSDLTVAPTPMVSVGAAFSYDLPQHRNELTPELTYNSSDFNVTGDVHFKWKGLSSLIAAFYRYSDHGAVFFDTPIQTMGFVGQLAYFHQPLKLEGGVRYAILDENVDLSGDHLHELTAVLNYHLFANHLKVQLEFRSLLPGEENKSFMVPYRTTYHNRHEVMLMAQLGF